MQSAILQGGVKQRGQPCLGMVSPRDIGMPDMRPKTQRAARHSHFAKVEGIAITAGTSVIASKMSGNVGMLGANYPGYFPVGDAAALVDLLRQCLADQNLMTRLSTACKARAALFTPSEEKRRLLRIVVDLLGRD